MTESPRENENVTTRLGPRGRDELTRALARPGSYTDYGLVLAAVDELDRLRRRVASLTDEVDGLEHEALIERRRAQGPGIATR